MKNIPIVNSNRLPILRVLSLAFVVMFCITFFWISIAEAVSQQPPQPKSDERIVTIFDQGVKHVVLTKSQSIKDVLKQSGISLSDHDIVEPNLDTKMTSTQYTVNIYRAYPVLIVDGMRKKRVLSPHTSPRDIVRGAGIELHDADTVDMTRPKDIVSSGGGMKVEIHRAVPIDLVLYGKESTVYTQAKTVGQFLEEKHIKLADKDFVSASQADEISPNMRLEIWRNGKQTVTKKESIDFPVRKIKDADHKIGYKKIKTKGKKGQKSVTYEVNMKNGKEVSRKEIQSVVLKEPKEQVVVVGTKISLPPGSHDDWMREAGISPGDFGYVNAIIKQESGWVPCKVQGGSVDCTYSGGAGYGLGQATPGRKMSKYGSDWRSNPITQLKWATSYAKGRYGSWKGAYCFKFGCDGKGGNGWW